MILYAHAKINLGLDVLDKREDGYHNIRTVMQTIGLCDCITFEEGESKDTLAVLTCEDPLVPTDDTNLIIKAVRILAADYPRIGGLKIHLEKNIPMAAGLAGGSTDAAAMLCGLSEYYGLGLSDEALKGYAVRLGADVPFLIGGGTALAEGIGEVLTDLASPPAVHILLAKPAVSVSTKEAYQNLTAGPPISHPDMENICEALKERDITSLGRSLANVFEPGIRTLYPEIGTIRAIMEKYGSIGACMSGSGPSVFGMFTRMEQAKRALAGIRESYPGTFTCMTDFFPKNPEILWPPKQA